MYLENFLYVAMIVALVVAVWAQIKVSTTFRKYSKTATATQRTADEVARMILDNNGLHDVRIESMVCPIPCIPSWLAIKSISLPSLSLP